MMIKPKLYKTVQKMKILTNCWRKKNNKRLNLLYIIKIEQFNTIVNILTFYIKMTFLFSISVISVTFHDKNKISMQNQLLNYDQLLVQIYWC